MDSNWCKVTKAAPCPICGKDHACKVSRDGDVAVCKRVDQGAFKESSGWYFHRLTPQPGDSFKGKVRRPKPYADKTPQAYPDTETAIKAVEFQCGGRSVAVWTYHNCDGGEAMKVVRVNRPGGGKQYRPIHLKNDGWRIGDPAGPLPLYRLNELPIDGPLYVCEGEKAADAATQIGLAATTSAHGSGAADKTDWTPLAGRKVCILPDNDEPGQKYAQKVAQLLMKLNPPARVKIVALPHLPPKGDIVDYIEYLDSKSDEDIRSGIEDLAARVTELPPLHFEGGPLLVCLADVVDREIDWLWPGRFPLGRLSMLVGRPGEGKSFLTTYMAARVTTGAPWTDGCTCSKGSVILISAEDDAGDTIKPRVKAHGGDCRKVHLLSAVRRVDAQGKCHDMLFTLADVASLEEALQQHPDCKLIVVDPIGSFLGGNTDSHRDNEVRAVLTPLAKLAEKYGVAVVLVAHERKASSSHADDLVMGSRAFTGIVRIVWHLRRERENKARRLLLSGKNNLTAEGDGLAFTIAGDPPHIRWEEHPVQMSADDALATENGFGGDTSRRGPEPKAREVAREWLRELLADGPMPVTVIKEAAKDAGLSWNGAVRRAREELGIKPYKGQFGDGWYWKLPPCEGAQDERDTIHEQNNLRIFGGTCASSGLRG